MFLQVSYHLSFQDVTKVMHVPSLVKICQVFFAIDYLLIFDAL